MRLIHVAIALLICLAVAGCVGEGGATTQPARSQNAVKAISIVATPTSTGSGVDTLVKSSDAVTPRATPTTDKSQAGPLSCIEQRMRSLQEGKVLPTGACT